MLAVPLDDGTINRRYTIRRADPAAGTVDLDFVVHGHGPGARWATDAPSGRPITAVGPRGKVVPAADVDWHLFVVRRVGLAGHRGDGRVVAGRGAARWSWPTSRARRSSSRSIAVADVYISWCNRDGGAPGGSDAGRWPRSTHLTLPDGRGHAYLSAELAVVRAVGDVARRAGGSRADDVSPKAYWRAGQRQRRARRTAARRLTPTSPTGGPERAPN